MQAGLVPRSVVHHSQGKPRQKTKGCHGVNFSTFGPPRTSSPSGNSLTYTSSFGYFVEP